MSSGTRPSVLASLKRRVTRIVDNRIRVSPGVTGKLMPLTEDGSFVLTSGGYEPDCVPPPELWENYAADAAAYLADGRQDIETMLRILDEHHVSPLDRVLDFGCSAGRLLRHLPRRGEGEYWGVDVSAPHIEWCQRHLPGANFATTTTAPHLPFEDGYFDLVYAWSVFTHISDLADAWLLELRRILKPGGCAYLTVHDLKSYDLVLTEYSDDPLIGGFTQAVAKFEDSHRLKGSAVDAFFFGADPESQVFYDPRYLTGKWGRWMDVLAYLPQAYNYQSVLLLRKGGGGVTSAARP